MAKTRKPPPSPPAPPAEETPSPQRRRKKKGRPSLLDLQRRSLRLQAQNPSPADSPARRDPNTSDDDDDGIGSGRRRQKRLKSVLAGGVKVGGHPLLRQNFDFFGGLGSPYGVLAARHAAMRNCSGWICGFRFFLVCFCGTARLRGGESGGRSVELCQWPLRIFCFLEGVAFMGGFGILFCFLRSPYDVGILTLSAL
jgi:hypothetical protein